MSAELIIQSAVGAAKMLRDSGEHPVALREAVTSPGGTTIAAIRELENHGVRAALLAAIEAAAIRSAELGTAHDLTDWCQAVHVPGETSHRIRPTCNARVHQARA